jgi:phosphoadenosine phosphosulfate reductase
MSVEVPLARPRRPAAQLQALVAEAAARFDDGSSPQDILRWFGERLGTDRIAVAVSFTDAVMATLAGQALPGVDVLFVDTGYHFAETLGFRDYVAGEADVRVRSLTPGLTVAEQDAQYGARLHERDPDACCAMRKTAPMDAALRGYDAWATGLRRADHAGRAGTPLVQWDERHGMIKINPIAAVDDAALDAFIAEHGILANPLQQLGYRSIGCEPCTRPVADGQDVRAGRWAGSSKTECGIHQ